ncbi:hypothetical protein HOY80DRAFT_1021049 [Tuber brumale]|nr:hypothetical protein HOY80DRAFT_1021049 [Tuber brumale]
MGPPYNRRRRLSENQPDRAQNSFQIASAQFSHESSVRQSGLGNHYPSLLLRGWLDSGEGQGGGTDNVDVLDLGDEFSDGSTTSECESGVSDPEESVANLCDEDEILEYLAKLANLIPTITDHEVVQSLQLDAGKEQSQSDCQRGKRTSKIGQESTEKSKATRLGDQVHVALVNAPDSWLQAPRKVTILSAAVPTASTEHEVTVCAILKAFDIAPATPVNRLGEVKTNNLAVVEVLLCTAALPLGLEIISRLEIKVERITKTIPKPHRGILIKALTLPRGGMRNEDVGERKGKTSEERLILKLKESKWSTRKNVSGKTMWCEEPQDSTVVIVKCSDYLRVRIAGKAVLRDEEKFESRGDVEADDLLTQGQQQATQRVLRDPEKGPNGNDPAKRQYNQTRLMDLQFNRNAEAAARRADRAKIER